MAKWAKQQIPVKEMLHTVRRLGAGSTKELKNEWATDSESVRRSLGVLMAENKVFPMAYQNAVVWLEVTGERGRPNVRYLRTQAGIAPTIRGRKTVTKSVVEESEDSHSNPTPAQMPKGDDRDAPGEVIYPPEVYEVDPDDLPELE